MLNKEELLYCDLIKTFMASRRETPQKKNPTSLASASKRGSTTPSRRAIPSSNNRRLSTAQRATPVKSKKPISSSSSHKPSSTPKTSQVTPKQKPATQKQESISLIPVEEKKELPVPIPLLIEENIKLESPNPIVIQVKQVPSELEDFLRDEEENEKFDATEDFIGSREGSPTFQNTTRNQYDTTSEQSEADNNSLYSDNGFSYVRDMLKLKGELKSKSYQLNGLIQETGRLERSLSKKEKNLFELNAELHKANEKIMSLEQELQAANESNEELTAQAENRKNSGNRRGSLVPKKNKKNESTMQRLDAAYQVARAEAVAASSTKDLPEELYKHVLTLDNQLNVMTRKYTEENKKNTELTLRCKDLEKYYQKASKEIQIRKETDQETKLSLKQNHVEQISILTRKNSKLQSELRSVRTNENIKTKRIQELEATQKDAGQLERLLHSSNQEKRARERRIVSLQKQIVKLEHTANLKDKQLSKVSDRSKGVPMNIWLKDRELLQGRVVQMKAAVESKDKTIEVQRLRILELCDRVDLIAKSLKNADPEGAKESDLAAQINGTFASSPGARFSSVAPVLETSTRSDSSGGYSDTPVLLIDDDGVEEELTDDLFDFTPEIGEKGSEFIPVSLYHVLEVEIQKLTCEQEQFQSQLQQKDEIILELERRFDGLAKQKVVNAGRETEKMVEKMSTVESENKKREKQYRMKIHKLQNTE